MYQSRSKSGHLNCYITRFRWGQWPGQCQAPQIDIPSKAKQCFQDHPWTNSRILKFCSWIRTKAINLSWEKCEVESASCCCSGTCNNHVFLLWFRTQLENFDSVIFHCGCRDEIFSSVQFLWLGANHYAKNFHSYTLVLILHEFAS